MEKDIPYPDKGTRKSCLAYFLLDSIDLVSSNIDLASNNIDLKLEEGTGAKRTPYIRDGEGAK